jgi:DNA (cytosine-5)-methyltransferase 1
MRSIELFAGAGGLGMGIELAGFKPVAVVEWDRWACDTIRENRKRGFPLVKDWPLWEGDVRKYDWSTIPEGIELLAGGPPCQPFSLGGKHRAHGDDRDMFPHTVEVVRRIKPKSFLIENVKGLTRSRFANYFQYILLQFEFPEVIRREREDWAGHLKRLQEEKTSGTSRRTALTYNVIPTLVNAANYGVPQRRERVFIVGFRSDLCVEWSFPKPTHGVDSLLRDQWVTGDYWARHRISHRLRPSPPERLSKRIDRLRNESLLPIEKPWRTVRDSLATLPDPRKKSADHIGFLNHNFQDGARSYPGHTGSPLDLPAKTLKAGDHGVPGGENMMVLDNEELRYFTVRESARLQTFPDGYIFHGSWTETMRQLGNAVPVALSRRIAASIAGKLAEAEMRSASRKKGRSVA